MYLRKSLIVRFVHIAIFNMLLWLLLACNAKVKKPTAPFKAKKPQIETTKTCFTGLDTTKKSKTLGCAGWTYKLLNSQYLIRINPNLQVQFDSCIHVAVDSVNADHMTELLVFANNKANLTSVCKDVIIINNPEPTRKLIANSGKLIIGYYPAPKGSGARHLTTVYIEYLVFVDSKTGKLIEIKDELLWKVPDMGFPG